jgi:hypothetical protein
MVVLLADAEPREPQSTDGDRRGPMARAYGAFDAETHRPLRGGEA